MSLLGRSFKAMIFHVFVFSSHNDFEGTKVEGGYWNKEAVEQDETGMDRC